VLQVQGFSWVVSWNWRCFMGFSNTRGQAYRRISQW
jgi:hypothetical protein